MSTEHRYLIPDWPAPVNIKSCVTKRRGGVSIGSFSSFNMGLRSGDVLEHILTNREQMAVDFGWQNKAQWLMQVHGTTVVTATTTGEEQEGDAVWTDQQALSCAVLTADCLPVLFCDQQGTVVAAAHAGWKGLLAGVLEETIKAMGKPSDQLMAWMGPAISQQHFEVGPEVRAAFVARDTDAKDAFSQGNGDRWQADLYQLARQRLEVAGISSVYGGGLCTFSQLNEFFSYRRDGQASGRLASVIWIE